MPQRFPPRLLAAFAANRYLRIRCGNHRFIAIWVVVVDGRVLVRSWNDKPGGWFRAFLTQPEGAVQLDGAEVPIRAVTVRSDKLRNAACAAYAAKYSTKANARYVKGFATARRTAATLELIPT